MQKRIILRHCLGAMMGCVVGVGGMQLLKPMTDDKPTLDKKVVQSVSQGAEELFEAFPVLNNSTNSLGGFYLYLDNLTEEELRIAYAWTLVTDEGVELVNQESSEVLQLDGGGFSTSEEWLLPELIDGFYRINFTVASKSTFTDLQGVQHMDLWFQVQKATVIQLTATEWLSLAPGASGAVWVEP